MALFVYSSLFVEKEHSGLWWGTRLRRGASQRVGEGQAAVGSPSLQTLMSAMFGFMVGQAPVCITSSCLRYNYVSLFRIILIGSYSDKNPLRYREYLSILGIMTNTFILPS